jgi:hypothetical protein
MKTAQSKRSPNRRKYAQSGKKIRRIWKKKFAESGKKSLHMEKIRRIWKKNSPNLEKIAESGHPDSRRPDAAFCLPQRAACFCST